MDIEQLLECYKAGDKVVGVMARLYVKISEFLCVSELMRTLFVLLRYRLGVQFGHE